uniref:NmrA-like domain-containing protein n=2 Tax=Pycnococcus provasolii TaxID=41880 RepID=A0A7S2BBM5_9CHLO|mmetsp:Transcript_7686/g.17417  ORF Transcript_7686/g.17417 Transcript_7686/m.17417 type:complete len:368 (+) Transcript_7686:29-1132(+)
MASTSMKISARAPPCRTSFRSRSRRSSSLHARSDAADSSAPVSSSGTPVKKMSMLVVGATGTLGRQVVRRALDEGYEVRALVRPRQNPADFLRDWGAVTVKGDLNDPSSLPPALVGVHTVVDCATARPEESVRAVDWEGKVALIQACQAMKIQRYVYMSIANCDKHPDVPLMAVKSCTEEYLQTSGLNYTVLRACGFMQALIGQYAIPILEGNQVWGTDDTTRTAYLNTQDAARMCLAAVRSDEAVGKTLTLAGPRAFTVSEVIALCEKLAGASANVSKVPVSVLRTAKAITGVFQWTGDAADRLAFAEVLSGNEVFSAPMDETYDLLGLNPEETTTVEMYLREYYTQILKKLKEVGAQSGQNRFDF